MARRRTGQDRWYDYQKGRWLIRRIEAERAGINAWDISRDVSPTRHNGLKRVAPGVYIRDEVPFDYPLRLAVFAAEFPTGVFCLQTALRHHHLIREDPPLLWMMLPRGAWKPRGVHEHLRFVHCAPEVHAAGIESVSLHGADVRFYGLERTVVEAFKHRRALGAEVAVQALFDVLDDFRASPDAIIEWARRLRVERIVRSYLSAWSWRLALKALDPEDPRGALDPRLRRVFRGKSGRPPKRKDPLPLGFELARSRGERLPDWVEARALPATPPGMPWDDDDEEGDSRS